MHPSHTATQVTLLQGGAEQVGQTREVGHYETQFQNRKIVLIRVSDWFSAFL